MFNEASNNNCLIPYRALQLIYCTQEKVELQKMKINATKTRKVCTDGNELCTGRMEAIHPSIWAVG